METSPQNIGEYTDIFLYSGACCVRRVFQQIEDVFVFDRLSSIKSPAPDLTFCVKTPSRTFYIVAPTSEVRQLWMEIIFTGAEGYRQFF